MFFRPRKQLNGSSSEPVRGEAPLSTSHGVVRLVEVHPGGRARVVGFSTELPEERRVRLQAYGLIPGEWLQVLQHSPVTIVQIENSELALEGDIARLVEVQFD